MTKTEVMKLLGENRNERGVAHWERLAAKAGPNVAKLKSFGIGLTQLRKLAKKVGRDARLAKVLWRSDVYDAKILGLLIDDPKQMTREQAEEQVDQLEGGQFAHVFASCDATLAKAPFAFDLAVEWMDTGDEPRKRAGCGLLYELSKKKAKTLTDEFFLERIDRIEKTIHGEPMWVRESMMVALFGIGKRNLVLNRAAIKAVKAIGPVDIDYGDDNRCEPLDVLKHLTSDYMKKKLQG